MHEISIVNNVANMAYVGETPWHGLGQALEPGASIEEWQAKALPFRVLRSKVRYAIDGTGKNLRTWDDQLVLFRSDNQAPLGVVSDGYKIVQPGEVLEFFRDLVSGFGFQLETAGALKGGRIYWALARINGEVLVAKGDPMRGYVLLSTSCDGSRKTEAANVSTRVVCANTLRMADGEAGKTRVRVSHRSAFNAESVKDTLGISRQSFENFMAQARMLAKRKVGMPEVSKFVLDLLGKPGVEMYSPINGEFTKAADEVFAGRAAKAILAKYAGAGKGAQLESARDTAWGLVNAVTEYVDHDAPARSNDNRLASAWFGPNGNLKDKALNLGLAMV